MKIYQSINRSNILWLLDKGIEPCNLIRETWEGKTVFRFQFEITEESKAVLDAMRTTVDKHLDHEAFSKAMDKYYYFVRLYFPRR